ncbi:predicted protein [Histoplasma capsulatum G186AR]|uniref:Uncharacterized protein n=2 Tax=Ajellomyces capsulatus TaxID=5037 RepID=C0NJ59_AJECG|nr:uncharacterized protein HCBG_03189 [Histoplasma capsulatum G186AR]EEH07900.1 predicted protein [Histoplasma capsulatum G186AR]KAG5299767.1 hypothetical protein I7I52_10188 [Histoplasma capsulatum]QSS67606.1 hypothetical protein I7I50_06738 [Histoplasma capsulatum G186AR]
MQRQGSSRGSSQRTSAATRVSQAKNARLALLEGGASDSTARGRPRQPEEGISQGFGLQPLLDVDTRKHPDGGDHESWSNLNNTFNSLCEGVRPDRKPKNIWLLAAIAIHLCANRTERCLPALYETAIDSFDIDVRMRGSRATPES